jgi:large subunit ribosomal protein L20
MPRVKRGVTSRRKVNRVMKKAKGFHGARSRHYRHAREAVNHSMAYAYADRRKRKRDFRQLWIARISAAVRGQGLTYSVFMAALKKVGVEIDRKNLSELAINDPSAFSKLVDLAKEHAA